MAGATTPMLRAAIAKLVVIFAISNLPLRRDDEPSPNQGHAVNRLVGAETSPTTFVWQVNLMIGEGSRRRL